MQQTTRMQLIIINASGEEVKVPFLRDEISVGRQEGNTIRLQDRNISRRHARLKKIADKVFIEDLDSYNGVMLNGNKVTRREVVYVGDTVQIGDFTIKFSALDKGALTPLNLESGEGQGASSATAGPTILSPTESQQPGSGSLQTIRDYSTGSSYKAVEETPGAQPLEPVTGVVQEPLVDMGVSHSVADEDDQRHRVPTRPTTDDEDDEEFIEIDAEPLEPEPLEPEPQPVADDSRNRASTVPLSDLEETAADILQPIDEAPVAETVAYEDTTPAYAHTGQQEDTGPATLQTPGGLSLQQAPDPYRPPLTTETALNNATRQIRRRTFAPVIWIIVIAAVAVGGYFGYTKYKEDKLLDEAVMLAGDARHQPAAVPDPSENAANPDKNAGPAPEPPEPEPALVPPPTPENPGAPVLSKDEIDSYISRGKKFLKLKKWADAQEAMAQILREIPDHEIAMDLRDEAKREAKCEGLLMNATKLYQKGKYDASLLQLTEIGEESVFHAKAQKLMGNVQAKIVRGYYNDAKRAYRSKQYAGAVRILERLLAMDPGHKGGKKLLPKAIRARNKQQAVKAVKEAPKKAENPTAELMRRGGTLFRDKNYAEAANIYKKVITIQPTNAMAYRSLGSCYAAMGKPDRAVRAYEKYIKFSPNAADATQVKQIIKQYKQSSKH